MTTLPAELIDEVFSHCSNDSLTQCALANKGFLSRVQSLLYSAIRDDSFDIVPPKLEYTMNCPSSDHLFAHTSHFSFAWCHPSYIPFLQGIHRLGRVETISQRYGGICSGPVPMYLDMILQISCLPTFRRLRFSMHTYINPKHSGSIIRLFSSPTLRDLDMPLPSYSGPISYQSSFDHLDTLRVFASNWDTIPITYDTVRRLCLTVYLQHEREVLQIGMKNGFTAMSHTLTHLVLRIETSFGHSDLAVSILAEDRPFLFTDVNKLHSLKYLALEYCAENSLNICLFKFSSRLITQISAHAPLHLVRLFMPPWLTMANTCDEDFERIQQIMNDRFPHAQLSMHFIASSMVPVLRGGTKVFRKIDAMTLFSLLLYILFGSTGFLSQQNRLSGEITDDCMR